MQIVHPLARHLGCLSSQRFTSQHLQTIELLQDELCHEAVAVHASKPPPGTRGKLHLTQLGQGCGEAVVHLVDIKEAGNAQLSLCLTLGLHHPG